MKKVLIFISLLLGALLFGRLTDLHFSPLGAIPGEVKEIQSSEVKGFGKAILFEETNYYSFGVAKLERKFGFLYRYDAGSSGYDVEKGKPFEASGIADNNHFLVAVKTAGDSNIKYIALGNHMEDNSPTDTYHLTLEEVKADIEQYHLKEVKNHYVLFVLDEYSEDTLTIRAFDKDGKLVADELFGGEARYIDWGTEKE